MKRIAHRFDDGVFVNNGKGLTMKKVLIMAGGTGGHIFPALTIADHCYAQGVSIDWLGSVGGMEERLVPAQYHLHSIQVKGLRGKGVMRMVLAPFLLLRAVWQAWKVIRRIKPDVVLGMGGFASGPGGLAARLLRLPLVIHEQNARAGLTNRCLSRIAAEVLQAFPDAFASLPRAKVVGNPIRQDIAGILAPAERFSVRRGPVRVLVLGGSRGAHAINVLVSEAFRDWPVESQPLLWHQVGEDDFEWVRDTYFAIAPTAIVDAFISNMAAAYEWADIVVSRSGALTVSEIAAVGVASILIPYPHAVDDHQFYNAQGLARVKAAQVMRQGTLSSEGLREVLMTLCADRSRITVMAEAARRLGSSMAGAKILAVCENVVRKREGTVYANIE